MTKNLHPEWFDLSLSILFQQGLVEETDEGGYKLTLEGEKEAKQATSVMYNGK
jgi:Mn-dependent DtxR family transcriptional regulator